MEKFCRKNTGIEECGRCRTILTMLQAEGFTVDSLKLHQLIRKYSVLEADRAIHAFVKHGVRNTLSGAKRSS